MEYTSDGCVRGIRGDGENGIADGVVDEGSVGDGMLYLFDHVKHLHGDGELLLGGS